MTTASCTNNSSALNNHSSLKIAIILALLAFACFVVLAQQVLTNNKLAVFDATISQYFFAKRNDSSTALAQAFTFIGGVKFILPSALGFILTLWLCHFRRASVLFALTMGFTSFNVVSLKLLFNRVRPDAANMLGPINEAFSFPSGHTMHSTVFFGLLAFFILPALKKHRGLVTLLAKTTVSFAWLLMCLLVAVSRIYLGYHWFTDVIAGFLLGLVVLALARILWLQCLGRADFLAKLLR